MASGKKDGVTFDSVQEAFSENQSNLYKFLQKFHLEDKISDFEVMGASENDPSLLQYVDEAALLRVGLTAKQAKKFLRRAAAFATAGDDSEGSSDEEAEEQQELTKAWKILETADGLSYYYNEKTKVNTWVRPKGITKLFLQPIKMDVAVIKDSEEAEDDPELAAVKAELKALEDELAAMEGELGYWKSATTAAGLTYYFNTDTGITSWERPVGFQEDAGGAAADGTPEAAGETPAAADEAPAQPAGEPSADASANEAEKRKALTDRKEHIYAKLRRKQLLNLMESEEIFFQRIESLFSAYLHPLEADSNLLGELEFKTKFTTYTGALHQIKDHHAKLAKSLNDSLKNHDELAFLEYLCTAIQEAYEAVYLPFVHAALPIHFAFAASERVSKKLQDFVTKADLDEKKAAYDEYSFVPFLDLILLPIARMHTYAGCLLRLQNLTSPGSKTSPTLGAGLATAMDVIKGLEETRKEALRAARMEFLASRVTSIPDNWSVSAPGRTLIGLVAATYIFDGKGAQTDVPPESHPFTSDRGESVQCFLFNDCLLLTTFAFKYRFRLELGDINARKRFDHITMFRPDLFVDMDDEEEDEELVDGHFPVGSLVRLEGFQSEKAMSYNGLHGRVESYVPDTDRYMVRMSENFALISVKKKNVALVELPDGADQETPQPDEDEKSDGTSTALLFDFPNTRNNWFGKIQQAILKQRAHVQVELRRQTLEQAEAKKGLGPTKKKKDDQLVNVFLRVRPFVTPEEKRVDKTCIKVEGDHMATLDQTSSAKRRGDRLGIYDQVFTPDHAQEDVFNRIGTEALGAICAGYNVAIMAYGNTGAGKTYTMFGDENDPRGEQNNGQNQGIVPRVLAEIFKIYRDKSKYKTASIEVSYIQVYNNQLQDLQTANTDVLKIKSTKKQLCRMDKLKKSKVNSIEEAMKIIVEGNGRRKTRAHAMNEVSSRSHAIYIMNIVSQKSEPKSPKLHSTVHFVDLAGSENVSITKVQGDAAQEAREINKSLISLGRVINALNENRARTKAKRINVPFRESKLTMLLSEVFLKDFVCSLVLNASSSPAQDQAKQTGKTMAFGEGLKKWGAKDKNQNKKDKSKTKWLMEKFKSVKVATLMRGDGLSLFGEAEAADKAASAASAATLAKLESGHDEEADKLKAEAEKLAAAQSG